MDWLTQNWIWILVLIGAYLLFFRRRHHGFGGTGGHHGHDREPGPAQIGRTATDPVSGRSLDAQHAITTYFRGRVYFFENEENRRRFEAAPEDFAKNAEGLDPARSQRGHRRHGC